MISASLARRVKFWRTPLWVPILPSMLTRPRRDHRDDNGDPRHGRKRRGRLGEGRGGPGVGALITFLLAFAEEPPTTTAGASCGLGEVERATIRMLLSNSSARPAFRNLTLESILA